MITSVPDGPDDISVCECSARTNCQSSQVSGERESVLYGQKAFMKFFLQLFFLFCFF